MKRKLPVYSILVDESGTLPDPNDKCIIIAGIGIKGEKDAENIITRAMKTLRRRKRRIRELKFYYAGERTRRQVLSSIVGSGFEIFVLVVDKKGRRVADTPENYSLLVAELAKEISLWKKAELRIIIDRHFHRVVDEQSFNACLEKNLGGVSYTIDHVNSKEHGVVNLADFVAGASLAKYNKNVEQFYDIFRENIIFEKIINWPELKRKSLGESKIS